MRSTFLLLLASALTLTACGGGGTNDDRGYTKAPLENPGLFVGQEPGSEMQGIGQPNRPRAEIIETPAPGGGAPPESTQTAAGGAQTAVALAPGVTQAQYDQGKAIFHGEGNCYTCHGPDAKGTQLAPDLTDSEWLHVPGPDVDALAQLITKGVPNPVSHPAPMPAMGGATLTPEQVRAVAGYVASLSQ